MAAMWGLPLKLVVTLSGIGFAMLTVTGTLIWLRKRRARTAPLWRR